MMSNIQVNDLCSALELLKTLPGQLIETKIEVDPHAELSGVYRHVGAGGTVMRPTKEGPAMIFQNVKGHEGASVVIGLLASRTRVGHLLGCDPQKLGFLLKKSVANPIKPVVIENGKAKCQEVVHYATEEGFDIRKLIPAPTNTPEDAGPYITLGMCYASNPETGESDVTIHSMNPEYDPVQCLKDAVENAHTDMPNVFVCHPGYLDAYLLQTSSLTVNRAKKVEMLCNPALREWLIQQKVQLITYRYI